MNILSKKSTSKQPTARSIRARRGGRPRRSGTLNLKASTQFERVAADAIEQAAKDLPALRRVGWTVDGKGDELDLYSVATSIAWLLHGPVSQIRKPSGISSYAAKHRAEEWGRDLGLNGYVANGDMLAACAFCRVLISRRIETACPNSLLGLVLVDNRVRR